MNVEVALQGIKDWYGDESYEVRQVTTEPKGEAEDFEQSDVFLSVVGFQESVGMEGDSFTGSIYFEYEKGKFITTNFWI